MQSVVVRGAKMAAALAAGIWLSLASVSAQDPKAFSQIKLTDEQVKNFIKAQGALAEIAPKMQAAGDAPDDTLKAELDTLAKNHGFAAFTEMDDVAGTIALVMSGLDPDTGVYTDPNESLQKELEELQKNTALPDAEKTQLTEELNEAIKNTPALQFKENVDIVKSNRADIEKAMQ